MATQVINNVLSWQVDTAAISQVQAANQTIIDSLQSVVDTGSQAAAQFSSIQDAANQLGLSEEQVQALSDQMGILAQNTANAGQQAQSAAQNYQDLGNGVNMQAFNALDDSGDGGGISTGGIRSLARFGGAALGMGGAGRDIGYLASAVGTLGAGALVAAPLLLAVGAATQAYNQSLEESETRAKAFGDALEKAFSGPSSGIEGYIQQTQAQLAADTAVRDSLQKLAQSAQPQAASDLDNASASIANFLDTAAGGPALAKVNNAGISQEAYNQQIDQYNQKIQLAQIALDAYNEALGTNATAANDATAALAAQTKQQEDASNLAIQIDGMTKDQRDKKAAQDVRDIDLINQKIQAGGLTQQTQDDLLQKETDLQNEYMQLSKATSTYADQLQQQADAKTAADNYLNAITAENSAIQAVSQAQSDLASATKDHAAALTQIQSDEQAKETADRQQAAQTAEQDAQKHYQKLAQIDAQANADHEADVGNRDALKNYQDAQKAQQAASDENASYTLQEQQQQAHLDTQLAQDKQAEAKQEQSENASWAKRQAQLQTALANAQVEESRAAGVALGYQKQQQSAELNQALQHWNAMYSIVDTYMTPIENRMITGFNNILNSLRGAGPDIGFTPPLKPGNAVGSSTPGSYSPLPPPAVSQVRDIVDTRVAQMMSQASN